MHSSRHRSSPYYSYTETSTDITESVPRPRFHSNGIGSDQKSSRDVVEGHLIPNLDTRDASESELEKPRSHGVHNDNFSVSQEKWDDDERRRQRFHRPGPSKRQLTSAHCMSDQESLSRGINRSASKERCRSVEYVPKAQPYRSGVLSNILMLYNDQERGFNLDEDLASSLRYQPKRALEDAGVNGSEDTVRIQLHIAEILARHQYLQDLCRAFMAFGAPTHRLEECMRSSARALLIDGEFLYMPGCMVISFGDHQTHTTEVKIVRTNAGINLGKLEEAYDTYKKTMHEEIDVNEASRRLVNITASKPKYGPWTLVLVYGLASVFVGPFAFQARLVDLPVAFLLGSLLGFLQHIVAPRSILYANVMEVFAAVLTSFLARAFGSLRDGKLFCFSALAQSSITMILPGYFVLLGALELQSHNMVAGSIHMVYAIISSLFLGFGITIGTALYGGLDQNATSEVICRSPLDPRWNFLVVPPFTLCIIVIFQGTWRQSPIMLGIASAGYAVNYFSAVRFASNVQIANTMGALVIGFLGNCYSRLGYGLSATAMLPAILVQVPGGLAASGSLVSGLMSADQITNKTRSMYETTMVGSSVYVGREDMNDVIFKVGFSMIQVAIGITVGLFLSSLLVYPRGKKTSSLFSF
ncbi:hypothetical protein MMC06_004273 [Schaereria dolodes]|nr:hypothetical protein [Schaereria dolodes]